MSNRTMTVAATLAALLLAGCASGRARLPGESLANAENAVARAELARTGDYDAGDLRAANAQLDAARSSARDKNQDLRTRWFAAEARADAELAIARAEWSKARAQFEAVQHAVADAKAAPTGRGAKP